MSGLTGTTTVVVGASRGLGLGIAQALADAGSSVVAVSRTGGNENPDFAVETGDAADPATAKSLLDRYRPDAVVVVAGAIPPLQPLQELTWETFSVNWHADVRIAFEWLREALTRPLKPGSRVVVVSSGAALAGSPLSGGYAGAKATQRFITGYARDESERAGLGITFTAVLPRITPLTDLGRPAVEAYAARGGQTVDEYLGQFGALLTPEGAGAGIVELLAADTVEPAYLLAAGGLTVL